MRSHHFAAVLILVAAPSARADVPAANFDASTVFVHTTGAIDRTVAWEFTANATLQVTMVGVFDRGAPSPEPGLGAPHEVVIWDANGGVVATQTVPAGTAGQLIGDYRYVNISPAVLIAGQNYIVGAFWPTAPFDHMPDVASSGTAITYDPNISFVQSHIELSQFAFPTIPVASNFAVGAVNFQIFCDLTTSYCTSLPNSTGFPAVISASGSASIAAGDLTLRAEPVPASQNGIFFYGPGQQQLPFGNGFLCVSGQISRLPITTSVGTVMTHTVDYSMPPTAFGQITASSVLNFQAWFRDPLGGGSFFNLTDAMEITFSP